MKKLDTLQTIRGIGALLVVFFHATVLFQATLNYDYLAGMFQFGYSGVDIFFVLSGFIIYFIHSKDIGVKEKGKTFFLKRFLRIYPVYWLIICFLLPVYFIVPSFGIEEIRNEMNILKSFILFPQPQENSLLGVSWSLSYEILFYLLFGLLITLKKRISYSIVTIWMAVTFTFFIFGISGVSFLYFIFNSYNIEFLLGVLIAHLVLNNKLKYNVLLVWVGTVCFVLSALNIRYEVFALHRVIEFGIPSFMIIYGLVASEIKQKTKTIPRVLTYLGDASYSIYLIHYPLLSIMNKIFSALNLYDSMGNFISITVIIVGIVIMGCLFHSLIEKPLLATLNLIVKGFNKKERQFVS